MKKNNFIILLVLCLIFYLFSCNRKNTLEKDALWYSLSKVYVKDSSKVFKLYIDTFDIEKLKNLNLIKNISYNSSSKFPMDTLFEILSTKDSVISIGFMKIKTLDENICKLKNLKNISIGGENYLTQLPESIGELKNLEYLDLGKSTGHSQFTNNIKELPASFSKLSKLKYLYLNKNPLRVFPVELCGIKDLWYLNIEGCTIDSLPSCFCDMKNTQIYFYHGLELFNTKNLLCKEKLEQKRVSPKELRKIKNRLKYEKIKRKLTIFSAGA